MMEENLNLDQVLALRHGAASPVVDVEEPVIKLVIFTLAEEWFAFAGNKIREILADSPVFFLPGCPASLEGVINVRGDIESVIRLHTLLGFPESQIGASSSILIGQGNHLRSGIRVDRVEEVIDLPQSSIRTPPHTLPEALRSIVLGNSR